MKCIEIIKYFNPRLYFIENPFTGMLKHRMFMRDLKSYRVDYCAYDSKLGMKKSTMIWSNRPTFTPRTCAGRGTCPSMVGRRHRCTCTGSYWDPSWKSVKGRSRELARVPYNLIRELLTWLTVCIFLHPCSKKVNMRIKFSRVSDRLDARLWSSFRELLTWLTVCIF
jgi:hypothetical protein